MALHMRFTSQNGSFETTVNPEVVQALEKCQWLREFVNDEEMHICLSIAELREEIARIQGELVSSSSDYVYMMSYVVDTPRGRIRDEGTGMQGGICINGECYSLLCDFNRCVLEHLKMDENGRGYVVSSEDVRDRSYIDTDSHGRIEIKRKKASDPAAKWLARLAKKIEEWSGEVRIDIA